MGSDTSYRVADTQVVACLYVSVSKRSAVSKYPLHNLVDTDDDSRDRINLTYECLE